MGTSIKSTAVTFAVLIFFVMAFAGWFKGLDPATCANRAFIGAVAIYIIVSIAGKALVSVVIEEIIESQVDKQRNQEDK